jgi:hypothetical protein
MNTENAHLSRSSPLLSALGEGVGGEGAPRRCVTVHLDPCLDVAERLGLGDDLFKG